MATDSSTRQEKLQALRSEFAASLPQRLAQIREAARDLRTDPSHTLALDGTFRRLVHNLAGAGGTFGFHQLGQEARELEGDLLNLSNGRGPEPRDLDGIETRLLQLEALTRIQPPSATEESQPSLQETPQVIERKPMVYVLEDDRLLAEELAQQLQHFGYDCQACFSPDEFRKAYGRRRPDAVVADVCFEEGPLEGPAVVAELRNRPGDPIPTLFVSAQSGWEARLAAVRAGGLAYLPKPVEVTGLVAELDRLTGRQVDSPFRVLLVDDEPLLARHYQTILRSGGLEAEILHAPAELLERLAVFRPDLLLLDLYMPACSGLEMARVVRQASAYTHLPIVFLSSEQSRDEQLLALMEGGDDFLSKPVSPAHLVGALSARARRFRTLQRLMTRDSLTGLLNHTNLKQALERDLSLSQRQQRPLSFAMLDIDHFKSVNDSYGHPVGDRVLKGLSRLLIQRLRKGDVIGRYGGEEFALILPDTDLEQAFQVVDQLRDEFANLAHQHRTGNFTASFSGGVAMARPGCTQERLIQAADAALYQAKGQGRNRVVRAAPPEPPSGKAGGPGGN